MSGILRLITGLKGAAKTLWVVDQLFKEYEKDPDRNYYSDITELKHTGVQPAPDDWTTIPDNSLIVYDEVQFKLLFSRHNSKRDTQILELTTMRKRGIEMWIITQRARFLNADVLGLVDQHVQIERNSDKTSKVYIFNEAEMNITKTKKMFAHDKYVFAHPKELYGFYESVKEGVEHAKRSFFNKQILFVIIPLVLCAFPAYYVIKNGFSTGVTATGSKEKNKENNNTVEAPSDDGPVIFKTSANLTQEEQQKILDRLTLDRKVKDCMSSYGWTDGMCREALDPDYLKANNERAAQISGNTMSMDSIEYDPVKPYATKYVGSYQVTSKPVFSGCMKQGNKYYAYSQQGTKLDVSSSDCQKLIDQGDRPFNYFKGNNNELVNKDNLAQIDQQNSQQAPKMTPEQYAKYLQYISNEAKNYVEPHLQARTVTGANGL